MIFDKLGDASLQKSLPAADTDAAWHGTREL